MKKMLVALVACLGLVGSVRPMDLPHSDGGNNGYQEKKCKGFALTADEAMAFRISYNVTIIATMRVVNITTLVPDEVQKQVVVTLKKFDEVAEGDGLGCVNITKDEVKVILETADLMSQYLLQHNALKGYVNLLMALTKGDKAAATRIIDVSQRVVDRLIEFER